MASIRASTLPPVITAGPLMLDTGTRVLTGPKGQANLLLGPYSVLRVLLNRPGALVETNHLIESVYAEPDLEPLDALKSVRGRIARAREAMEQVGVSGRTLRSVRGAGYVLEVATVCVVRMFTPAQAAALDHLLATHPNRAAVAEMAA